MITQTINQMTLILNILQKW